MTGDERFQESAVIGDREVEAEKEKAERERKEAQGEPDDRPQSQQLVVDGTDG
ncbi:MAG TPA: hypothetical protein VF170_00930 [Planctomycetaceae bacterium]